MRKHFAVALESHKVDYSQISMEEEAVMIDEAKSVEAEVPADLVEADRLEATSDSLEDLAVIADGIDEASPEEIALVRTVSDMAVAGTDVQSEEVIPETVVPLQLEVTGEAGQSTAGSGSVAAIANEAYIGRKIATETIREVARNIWESIKKFLKEIWAKIEKFFYNILGEIPRLRRSIEGLKKRVEAVSESGKVAGKDKITINVGVAALSIDYKPVTTASATEKAIDDLAAMSKWVFGDYVNSLSSVGEKIATVITGFDAKAAGKSVDAMIQAAGNFIVDVKISGATKGSDKRYPDYSCKTSPPLIGNVSLMSRYKERVGAEKETLAALDQCRTARLELNATSDTAKEGPKEFQIMPFTTSEMESILNKSEKLIDVLEDFKRGAKLTKITKTRKDIETASNKAETSVNTLKASDAAGEREVVPYYRAILNFNKAYASWSASPIMTAHRHVITSINAVNSLIAKSLSAYKAV